MYLQLQKNYPEYGITDEEVEAVSHLAPIHDIGKIRVPVEILNKNGRLTDEEMETVRQHPLVGAEMTKKFPKGLTIDKLNALSYEICRMVCMEKKFLFVHRLWDWLMHMMP